MNLQDLYNGGWNPSWLFEGYIPRAAVTILYGPGETLKSTLCRTLAMSVLSGKTLLPSLRLTSGEPGKVSLIASEDPAYFVVDQMRRTAEAAGVPEGDGNTPGTLKNIFGFGDAMPLHFSDQAGEVTYEMSIDPLCGESFDPAVPAACGPLQEAWNHHPDLVVVDPAINFFRGSENSSEDAARFMYVLNEVARDSGAAVVLVTHATKAAPGHPSEMRGSSVFRNEARAVFSMDRRGSNVLLTCQKMNLAPRPRPIELSMNADGLLISVEADHEKLLSRALEFLKDHPDETLTLGAVRTGQGEAAKALINYVLQDQLKHTRRHVSQAIHAGVSEGLLCTESVKDGKGNLKKIIRIANHATA